MTDTFSGTSVNRLEDFRFLTGQGCFAADMEQEGQLHAVVVRSVHAHAELKGIDIAAARAQSGIIGVNVAKDLDADGVGPLPCGVEVESDPLPSAPFMPVPPRHALARDRVRHIGEPVVLVVAETHAAALAAAELVDIDYAPLAAVVDGRAAREAGARIYRFCKGDQAATGAAFDAAEHVVELEIVNHRVTAAPMEPRAGIGAYDAENDVYTLTLSAQGLHGMRGHLARVFDLPIEKFRLAAPDVGGGFGLKNFLYPEWVLLAWASRHHGRPVKWIGERGEEFAGALHGRDINSIARLALDREGRFLALEADLTANLGAYLSGGGPGASTRAAPTAMGGVYDIAHIYMETHGVLTNTMPVDAYRGAGKPEANFIIERLIDVAARRHGFDPVDLRMRNILDTFPHRTAQGMDIDGGRFKLNIVDAVRLADRDGFEERRRTSAAAGRLRGLGVGCFLETARSTPKEGAEIRFRADGGVELRVGTESNGQGHETAYAQLAADRFGLPLDGFDYIQADTGRTRIGFGHGGARSMHMGGAALVKVMDLVLEKAEGVAAQMLQTAAGSVAFEAGRFTASGTGQSASLMEVAAAARTPEMGLGEAGLDTFAMIEDAPFTFPNGCHVAEVEVDRETGTVDLLRYIMVDDYGNLVNPKLTEGQVQGGVAQGIGQAIGERIVYDGDTGQLLSGSMMDYLIPAADHLPAFETHLEGVATNANPLGVKGSGQAGCIGAPQTIINAILDALAPLGVDHLDMPATPETVWRAIRDARD